MNVSFDAYYGLQNSYKLPQMLNAQEYAVLMNEARLMDGLQPYDFASLVPDWDKIASGQWKGTNWIDEIFRTGSVQRYAVTMTGGSDQLKAYASAEYSRMEGTMLNTWSENFGAKQGEKAIG